MFAQKSLLSSVFSTVSLIVSYEALVDGESGQLDVPAQHVGLPRLVKRGFRRIPQALELDYEGM